MKKFVLTAKFFIYGVKNHKKYEHMNFLQSVIEELYMMFAVMGLKLYINYANGTAVFEE